MTEIHATNRNFYLRTFKKLKQPERFLNIDVFRGIVNLIDFTQYRRLGDHNIKYYSEETYAYAQKTDVFQLEIESLKINNRFDRRTKRYEFRYFTHVL